MNNKVQVAADEDEAKLILEENEREIKRNQEQFKNDLAFIMDSVQGRRFVSHLLDDTGINRLSFTGNSSTFFNEGQRNIGLRLQAMLQEHCPGAYVAMLNERLSRKKLEDK